MEIRIDDILDYLNAEKRRCTYGAAAGVLETIPISVGKWLGKRRPEASWVVQKKSGRPTGYTQEQMHREFNTDKEPITDPTELGPLVEQYVLKRRGG